jgi:MFS family permease
MDPTTPRVISRTFWAEGISRVGDAVSTVALPLTAVLALGASAAELALIGAAQALPILLLSVPAGAWVDRRAGRWPILLVGDLARAGLLALVPLAAAANLLSVPLLAVVAFGTSTAGTFFDVAFAGWLPRLLQGDDLHRANARVELARSSAVVIGPAVGGALVSALSAPVALLADAASFVWSAGLIATVRRSEALVRAGHGPVTPLRWAELGAGLRYVLAEPYLRAVLATAGINNLARSIALGVAILYLVDTAGLTAAEIGVAFALGNSGFVVGALVARRATARLGMGRTMQLAVGLFGPSMLLFALSPAPLAGAAFAAMLFANGLGISIHNVNQVTVRQVLIPDRLRGRAAAVFRLVIFGAIPVGTVLGGLVGQAVGLQAALLLSACGLFLGATPYLLARITRLRSIHELALAATP